MTKRRLFILAILLFTGSCTWAQRNYRSGYIITNQHDTIRGWIDYRGDIRNAVTCSFKATESGQVTDYTPLDIFAYRFTDGKYYLSKNVGDTIPKHVFLEYLVKGVVHLLYYRESDGTDCYFLEKDEQLLALEMYQREVYVDKQLSVRTLKPYIGILKSALQAHEISKNVDFIKLEHKPLVKLVKKYHTYMGLDSLEYTVYDQKKPLLSLRFGPVVGVDFSTAKISKRVAKNEYSPKPSTNFSVGANLNVWMPRINEKIFMQLQAMYTKYYFFGTCETSLSSIDVHIRSNVVQTGLSIKYEYPTGKWRPALAVGGAAIFLSSCSIEEVIHRSLDVYIYSSSSKTFFPSYSLHGFGITPGIHYYFSKEWVFFVQAQYLYCIRKESFNRPANVLQSFGLSAGVYF